MTTITFQSITGVDVELRVAGAGSRSYAFVIDWHIRLILALAWFFVFLFVYTGSFLIFDDNIPEGSSGLLIITLPPTLIYFLYHPVLEIVMRGRTPGKRMAGVRIVSRSGDIPSAGAILLRNVFRLVDSLPFAYLLGLGFTLFTEHHVRIGDLAAGTLLVHDESDSGKALTGLHTGTTAGGLSPQSADLIQEVLDRWEEFDNAARTNLARSLIARVDPTASAYDLEQQSSWQLRMHLQRLLKGPAA